MASGKQWTRDEHLLAFNLYCQLPFGKLHSGTPEIRRLGERIGRSANSVAMKLNNFARLDPALQVREISGLSHGARGEEEIWEEFAQNPEQLAFESEKRLAELEDRPLIPAGGEPDLPAPNGPTDRDSWVRQRVNQHFFRKRVLSAYGFQCCVTGLRMPQLLIASHIVPWHADVKNRLNPRNGLCLNALHDRAFDQGLMWIDPDLKVRFRRELSDEKVKVLGDATWIVQFEGRPLRFPGRTTYRPDRDLLRTHATAKRKSSSWA